MSDDVDVAFVIGELWRCIISARVNIVIVLLISWLISKSLTSYVIPDQLGRQILDLLVSKIAKKSLIFYVYILRYFSWPDYF